MCHMRVTYVSPELFTSWLLFEKMDLRVKASKEKVSKLRENTRIANSFVTRDLNVSAVMLWSSAITRARVCSLFWRSQKFGRYSVLL